TGVTPSISIDKVTIDGSASGDNLTILAGEPITWQYTITNNGDVALDGSTIVVSDDQPGVTPTYLSGDVGNDNILSVGESWVYTATGTATIGTYTNTGEVDASYTDSAGHTAHPSDTDGSGYFGADPEIAITKVTTGSTSVGTDGTLGTSDDGKATG